MYNTYFTIDFILTDAMLDDETKNAENHIADDPSSIPKDKLECRRLSFTSQIDERSENEGNISNRRLCCFLISKFVSELINVTLPGPVPVQLNIVLSSDDFDRGTFKRMYLALN